MLYTVQSKEIRNDMSDYSDWRERADRGTSGEMVNDILSDWSKERRLLSEAVIRLLKFNEEICQDVNVSTNYPSAVFAREIVSKYGLNQPGD